MALKRLDVLGIHAGPLPANMLDLKPLNFNYTFGIGTLRSKPPGPPFPWHASRRLRAKRWLPMAPQYRRQRTESR